MDVEPLHTFRGHRYSLSTSETIILVFFKELSISEFVAIVRLHNVMVFLVQNCQCCLKAVKFIFGDDVYFL